MKSFILLILASALSVMSSTPAIRKSMSQGFSGARAVGAAYFMTNEPSGNYLVSATIASDGKLALYEAAYTGGTGAHGMSAPPGPPGLDALFSQGSVRVSASRNFVANVNAGSNTVTVFGIDSANPGRLSMIGRPVHSGGQFPTSLAINKAGNRVCVVNGGKTNGVSCYNFDPKKGLTPSKNSIRSLMLNQTTPATGPPNTPSQIIFSPDEKHLIVSVKDGSILMWDINADGSLSPDFRTMSGGVLPFSLLYVPGKNAIIASDPGVGYDIFNLDTNTTVSTPIPNQGANCWSAYSAESGNFYLIDVGLSVVTEVHVTASLNSTIVKQYAVGTDGPIDTDVATIGKKDFIYSLAANATGLTVLAVNGPGKAQVYQRIDLASPAKAANLPLHSTNLQGMATFIRK
ncbi:hypothetical protein B0H17DRAFT_1089218 [Mycena rosella]|uniref:3-carboxymuconate cyclase n=1 Tax=Mycena rosella TaxID=1033263 RepID=A0AAD7CXC0_MYCRO|nr:hypothetical protein B0H17DRAFT_1089218 [Mycena rosella]